MSDTGESNKERNRKIAHNEETRQEAGNLRVSGAAIVIAVIIGAVLFGIGWIAYRQ